MRRVMPWCAMVLLASFAVCAYAQTVDMKGLVAEFKPDSSGKAELVARVQATDWIKAASAH